MEAVKERPLTQAEKTRRTPRKQKQKDNASPQDLTSHDIVLPMNDSLETPSPTSNTEAGKVLEKPSPLEKETSGYSVNAKLSQQNQTSVATIHQPVNSNLIRINQLLVYPVGLTIYTSQLLPMRFFYENVLELKALNIIDQNFVSIQGNGLFINLIRIDSFNRVFSRNNIDLELMTDHPLPVLFQKFKARGVPVEQTMIECYNIPVLRIQDPDGNVISLISTRNQTREKIA